MFSFATKSSGGIDSIEFVDYVASTSADGFFTLPSSILENDIGIYCEFLTGIGGTYQTRTPSGFIFNVTTFGSAPSQVRIAFKKLTSGDAGSTLQGSSSGSGGTLRRMLLVFRPNISYTNIVDSTPSGQYTTSNPNQQTVAMSATSAPAIGIAFYAASNDVDPRTSSITMSELSNTTLQYAKYKIFNSGDVLSDFTVDMDDEGTNALVSMYLSIN